LDQYLESPFAAPSPPDEEVPATSSKSEAKLDDVIDKIGRLNLDSTHSQSIVEPSGPSHKFPKWVHKTLESVHPDEVGKIGTKSLYEARQENGGNVDNSYSSDVTGMDQDVSYNCELNLSPNHEPNSFE